MIAGTTILQTNVDEVLEAIRVVPLQNWRRILGDQEQHLHRVDIRVRRLAHRQLYSGDSERPDIRLLIIARLFDNLRSHPKRCANKGILLRHGGSQLTRDTKIRELHLTIRAQQHIRSFTNSAFTPHHRHKKTSTYL